MVARHTERWEWSTRNQFLPEFRAAHNPNFFPVGLRDGLRRNKETARGLAWVQSNFRLKGLQYDKTFFVSEVIYVAIIISWENNLCKEFS